MSNQPMPNVGGRKRGGKGKIIPDLDDEQVDRIADEVHAAATTGEVPSSFSTDDQPGRFDWPSDVEVSATGTTVMDDPPGLARPGYITVPPIDLPNKLAAKILGARFGTAGVTSVAPSAILPELERALVKGWEDPSEAWLERLEGERL